MRIVLALALLAGSGCSKEKAGGGDDFAAEPPGSGGEVAQSPPWDAGGGRGSVAPINIGPPIELDRYGLVGTIRVPEGAEPRLQYVPVSHDANGIAHERPELWARGKRAESWTLFVYPEPPVTLAEEHARNATRSTPRSVFDTQQRQRPTIIATRDLGGGRWSMVARATTHCVITSHIPRAGLTCWVEAACDDAPFALAMCGTIEPGATPSPAGGAPFGAIASRGAPAVAAAQAFANALEANDTTAFLALVGPDGLWVDGAVLAKPALARKLAKVSIKTALDLDTGCSPCTWTSEQRGNGFALVDAGYEIAFEPAAGRWLVASSTTERSH